ncbi:MAG: ABC transporter permease [Chloroflexota bacterium]|nr:ABC transporter permease [Chloroflexota bacterium]
MGQQLLSRLTQTGILIVVVTLLTFLLITQAPGGPAILLDPNMTPEQAAELRRALGLDEPFYIQYWRWLGQIAQGNLGTSYSVGQPVLDLIKSNLPNTLLLSATALVLSVGLAIPAGIISAARRYSVLDHSVTFVSFFGISVPVFWYGLILILIFSIKLGWLPSGGMRDLEGASGPLDVARHLILPAIVLATANIAQLARYTRSAMVSVLSEDYIRTARSKGLREQIVLYRHALRNAMIPVLTAAGLLIPRLVGGAAVTETVFAWPGMGSLAVRSAFARDYPTIMGITLVVSLVVIVTTLIVDILYVYADPRIRFG